LGSRYGPGIIIAQATDALGVKSPWHRVHYGPSFLAPPPELVRLTTPSPFPQAQVGVPYNGGVPFQLQATGGTAPYTWTYSRAGLAPGLSLNTQGQIVGTPTGPGGANVWYLTIKDSSSPQLSSFPNTKVTLITPAVPTVNILQHQLVATAGQPFSGMFQTQGGTPPYTYSFTNLPPGITYNATTRLLEGTPTTPATYQVGVSATDSSPTPLTSPANWWTMFTVISTTPDWTRPSGVIIQQNPVALTAATTPPPHCATLTGAPDLTMGQGQTHFPSYDGLHTNSPLTAHGNTFKIGWVQRDNDINSQTDDTVRNYLPPGISGDPRIMGQQMPSSNVANSLKWQVGTAPGRYRIWLGWCAYVPPGTQPVPGGPFTGAAIGGALEVFRRSGAQFALLIRDSNGPLAYSMAPNVATPTVTPSPFCDAASNIYATAALWGAAVDPAMQNSTYGGVSIIVNTTDASNGNGGPFIYFDCLGSAGGNGWGAILNYCCAQYLGPVSPISITSLKLSQQRRTVAVVNPDGTAIQLTAQGGTLPYTWTKVSGPAWLSVSAAGVVTGTPDAAAPDVTSFVVEVTDSTQNMSAPQTIPISIKLAPSLTAPQRVFPGMSSGISVMGGCWPPANGLPVPVPDGEPDEYWVYRDGTLIQTGIKPMTCAQMFRPPYIFFSDRDLPNSVTHTYDMTAVTAGIESAHSAPLTLSTGAGAVQVGTSPTLPDPPVDPATWMPTPFSYNAASGVTWIATQTYDGTVSPTTAPPPGIAGTDGPGVPAGTGNVGCSVQWALAHCQPGDTIVCTAGATYTSAWGVAMYQLPMFPSTTTQCVNIISSEEPSYKAGGALIPYATGTARPAPTPLAITGFIAPGVMQATLARNQAGLTDASGNWLPRTRRLPTFFVCTNTARVPYLTLYGAGLSGSNANAAYSAYNVEMSHVFFTHGSNTITWLSPFPIEAGQTVHPGATAVAYVYPVLLTGVDPGDIPNMATWQLNTGGAAGSPPNSGGYFGSPYVTLPSGATTAGVLPGTNHFRFIGINFTAEPNKKGTPPALNGWGSPIWPGYTKFPSAGDATQLADSLPPVDHFHYDRCIGGMDSEDLPNFSHVKFFWLGAANHLSALQCHFWGFVAWDGTDNYVGGWLGGSNHLYQDTYLEAASETTIWGGGYVAEAAHPSDITWARIFSAKPTCWQRNIFGASAPGTPPPIVPAVATAILSGSAVSSITLVSGGANYVIPPGVTLSAAPAGGTTATATPAMAGHNLVGFNITNSGSGYVTPPTVTITQYQRRGFGQKVKNHFELKVGIRVHAHHCLLFGGYDNYNPSGSQSGAGFATGTRDSGGVAFPIYYNTNPWSAISDCNFHDNVGFCLGKAFGFFGPCQADQGHLNRFIRYRYVNNMNLFNPGAVVPNITINEPFATNSYHATTLGLVSDIIIDHNTMLMNHGNSNLVYWNATTGMPPYPRGFYSMMGYDPWVTLTGDLRNNRFQYTNNIIDAQASNATFPTDNAAAGTTTGANATRQPIFMDVWISNNLRASQDTANYLQTSAWSSFSSYAAIGFAAWPGSAAMPPIPVSNWNVTTGPNATAATDGGPLGATLT
jgi:hypothetical protein